MDDKNNSVTFAEERKLKIIELLKKKRKVLVPELSEYFNVSSVTIRNDLNELEKNGLLKRTYGGAIDISKTGFEANYYQREVENLELKKKIAFEAIKYVEDGDVILIDTGTTTLQFAELLGDKLNINAVVNDIEIAKVLEDFPGVNVMMIGGMIKKKFHCTLGTFAANTCEKLCVDKAFMATNGISIQKGLTTPDINLATLKNAMVNMASEVIVLCESSKFGKNTFSNFAPIEKIDKVITDNNIDEEYIKSFTETGVEIIVAK